MKKRITTTILILAFISFLYACCSPEPTLAYITIKNMDNELVKDAQVIIYGSPTSNTSKKVKLKDTMATDISGVAVFDLSDYYKRGQSGVAILDIEANLTQPNGNQLTGTGIMKIVEEEINKVIVYIQ